MMNEEIEDDLCERFTALRKHDGRSQPEFHRVLNGARHRSRNGAGARLVPNGLIAAAAVLVIGAALLIGKSWDRPDLRSPTELPAISAWQSPTAALLRAPARELIAPGPLLSSVFDGVTTTVLQTKSD